VAGEHVTLQAERLTQHGPARQLPVGASLGQGRGRLFQVGVGELYPPAPGLD
jgi:hypothetical protein